VNKRFRVCDLDQQFLLPPALQDWLPEEHLARFIADVTNELDLSGIYSQYERSDGRGLSAYHPLLLTRLLLYGYCTGVTSSRRMERATHDDIAFRHLAANQHRTTIRSPPFGNSTWRRWLAYSCKPFDCARKRDW
jgi:transposase